jgi:hypothetical protein
MKFFEANVPHLITEKNDKLLFPFGPCIFQTYLQDLAIDELLKEGRKLKKQDSCNFNLASNFKYGQTYAYKENFKEYFGAKFIMPKIEDYLNGFNLIYKESVSSNEIYLQNFWINFSKKHDFNPGHTHKGFLSFVIYCDVPQNIFSVQAETNSPLAGKTVFEYGENISEINKTQYVVSGHNNLFLIFPSSLRHFVPPYWVDEERITVSGNIMELK